MIALIAAVVLTATPVYKCTADGRIAFQSTPCAGGEQVKLRPDPPRQYQPAPAPEPAAAEPAPTTTAIPSVAYPAASTGPESYRCESENGEVWFQHTRCPLRVVATHGTVYRASGAYTATSRNLVQETAIPRSEACREIEAIDRRDRYGSERDEVVKPYDKRAGRDPC